MLRNAFETAKTFAEGIFGSETSIWDAFKNIPSIAVSKVKSCGEKCKVLIKTYFPSASTLDGDPKKLTIGNLFGIFSDFGKFYEDQDEVKQAALAAALDEIGFVNVSEEGGSDENVDGKELSVSETASA